MNISYKKREIYRTAVLCFFLVVVLFAVIQAISGLYPFGSKYNLIWDEDIQYVDFFSFYKDVLLGKADIGYSFSKSAGGSLIALFGYYLGSPLNLLVVFFEKEQIPMFLFFLTAVKLGLCGFTAHIFFRRRFPQLSVRMAVMLSCSYGLMQYNILQCSNVMWLDGVLLLPLILLSVYEFLEKDKKAGLFWTIFLSITISWYTGYMTGIFSVLYFFYERLLKIKCFDKKEGKKFLIDTIRCGSVMFSGLLASCFLFYPVYVGLKKGKAVFDASIFQYAVHGSFIDIFRGFAAGGMASTVSLYCGLIFFGFFLYYFISRKIDRKEKILSIIAAGFMFASCWLVPLDCIWSGFRLVESFHFRYSFVVIFLVLYLAAKGIAAYEQEPENKKLAILFVFCIGIFSWFHHKEPYDSKVLFVTLGVLMLYAVIFLIGKERILKYFLPVILAGELILNAVLIFAVNYGTNGTITTYQEYVEQEEKLIEEVKKAENDKFYRMEALQRRNDFGSGCSAYLNQSMVYGYRGLAHYSSAYDANFAKMLFNFGYSGDEVLSGMQESILSSDSLLGIRYLVSKKAVPGYEKLEELPVYNGKSVYYNPYALGFGMEAASSVFDPVESSDPFTYQNQLFSNIMGYEVELFHRIEPRIGLENQTLSFLLPGDNTENQIYGYVDTWIRDLELYIDEEYRCSYAAWLGYKVFSVGQSNQEHLVSLNRFTGAQTDMLPHFYYLDQQVFEKVIQELKGREMQLEVFKDGYIKGSYTASKDGQLLLSMPYDSGWRIFVNGTRVEAKEGVEALEVIPVVEGENQIEMKYYVPGMEIGILLSVIGILMFAGICYLSRKKSNRQISNS